MTPLRPPVRRLRSALAGAATLAALAPASALAHPVGEPVNAGLMYSYGAAFNPVTNRVIMAGSDSTSDGHIVFLDSSLAVSDRSAYPDPYAESWQADVAAGGPRGDQLVVYTTSQGVLGLIVDRDGRQGTPVELAPRGAVEPAVAFDPSAQEYFVAWNDGGVIRGKRVSATGVPVGSGTSRVSDRATANARPDVAARPGGGWLVVWQTKKGGATEVVAQDVAPSGSDRGPDDFAVSSHRNLAGKNENAEPAVAVDPVRGEALVAYSDSYEVYAQRVSARNARVGGSIRVSSMGPDGQAAYEAHGPSVAFQPKARSWLVAWTGNDAAPITSDEMYPKDAYAQHLTASGTAVGPDDFRLSTVSETDLGAETDVVADPRTREFVATWLDSYHDHNGEAGTFARRVLAP